MSEQIAETSERIVGPGEIAGVFLKIGAMSYGGPAIMGIMQAEIQEKRGWISKQEFVEGQWYQASTIGRDEPGNGRIEAIDPKTGKVAWVFETVSSPTGGMLATAGGLVFAGDAEGYLIALDARTGKAVWRFQTGGTIIAPPISYALNGRQYIAVAAGQAMITFTLPRQ